MQVSNLVPRESKEIKEHLYDYRRLEMVFEKVLEWQREVVRFVLHITWALDHSYHCYQQMDELHPQTTRALRQWIDILPNNDSAPARPWSGVVVNANIATRAHRDCGDNKFCMVMVISNCSGGALVFYEMGLIVEFRNGDTTIFDSVRLTHYNLDFIGIRGSMVFHNDKAGERWAKDANGWIHNDFFTGRHL